MSGNLGNIQATKYTQGSQSTSEQITDFVPENLGNIQAIKYTQESQLPLDQIASPNIERIPR